jgi:hypothetical protein
MVMAVPRVLLGDQVKNDVSSCCEHRKYPTPFRNTFFLLDPPTNQYQPFFMPYLSAIIFGAITDMRLSSTIHPFNTEGITTAINQQISIHSR